MSNSIPTVNEIAAHIEHDLSNDAIQLLIDDAEEEVIARFGAHAAQTEILEGGGPYLFPRRPISAITTITETVEQTDTVLVASDYEVQNNGWMIKRLTTGTNGQRIWAPEVEVIYTPVLSWDSRRRVIIDLVKLAIQYKGLRTETIGDRDESFGNYIEERAAILETLRPRQRQFA